ncbi:MAG: UDP-N-acetylglucosamine--N-acetylmuramyl-(pentapeptide) pyrophosphoryl-undecaprenol N-acetylglucosamine transferase, partial [Pseudomonadales bacterium]|nr:UDP-N-acetylglucosamine--N-acetylmuramyl-(pentapeptide) pyrophosphoryl-undecaprenol N-acetylglucosamine transferase [Pseudomonadales bacterium]
MSTDSAAKVCKVLVTTGHSGGHIVPALTIANVLRDKGCELVWLGRKNAMEARLVPQHGIPIHLIDVSALRGKGIWAWLTLPFRLTRSVWQAWRVIRKEKPDVVFGGGGYVSVPGGIAAWLMRIPLVLHEQNSVPGLANRLLARLSHHVCEAFPNSISANQKLKNKVTLVGNPVRTELLNAPAPAIRYAERRDAPRLFITGGSQGAAILNETVPDALKILRSKNEIDVQVWHQAGEQQVENTVA